MKLVCLYWNYILKARFLLLINHLQSFIALFIWIQFLLSSRGQVQHNMKYEFWSSRDEEKLNKKSIYETRLCLKQWRTEKERKYSSPEYSETINRDQ